ncbi:MAG: CRISPR-associated endonuclease Cas1, partial [Promethearchaeota archaeon]
IIEAYRIFAEETVLGLFSAKKVNKALFDKYRNGLSLNKDGKKTLMEKYNIYLDETVRYSGRNIKRRDIIQFDAHKFANKILEL